MNVRSIIAAVVLLTGLSFGQASQAQAEPQQPGWNAGADVSASCLQTTVDYVNPGTPEQDLSGCLVGLGLNTDYTFRNGIVLGAAGDVSFGDLNVDVEDGLYIHEQGRIDRMATLRGVLGYNMGRATPYATAGLAWVNLTQGEDCPDLAQFGFCRPANGFGPFDLEQTHWQQGVAYGGGLIYQVAPGWRIWAEYLQMRFDDDTYVLCCGTTNGSPLPPSIVDHEPQVLRVGARFSRH